MRFTTTAKRRLSPLATSCLEQTRKNAGLETTPRTLTTSMVGPRSANLARPALGMPVGETCTGACLSTRSCEVCSYNSPAHLKQLNGRNSWPVKENRCFLLYR